MKSSLQEFGLGLGGPAAPLRFQLADDPGAGKTTMAGLLIKELRLREVDRFDALLPKGGDS